MKLWVVLFSLSSTFASSLESKLSHSRNPIRLIKRLLEKNELDRSYNYCIPGTLTCRQLKFFKNIETEERSNFLTNVFQSAEREVGSTGYFIPKSNGKYRNFLDEIPNGKIEITRNLPENQNVTVTFDSDGFPTVKDINIKRVGTTRFTIADLTYSETESTIIGVERDAADPEYLKRIFIIYPRVFQ